jgi:hypothetical protein
MRATLLRGFQVATETAETQKIQKQYFCVFVATYYLCNYHW